MILLSLMNLPRFREVICMDVSFFNACFRSKKIIFTKKKEKELLLLNLIHLTLVSLFYNFGQYFLIIL